jgi:hypothetical protein
MAKTRRAYTGGAVETTTTSSIAASGTTTFTVSAATGWPYGTDPYHIVLSPGTASEEKVLVTRTGSADTTINIASDAKRGQDGTSAVSHDSGATVYPVFTAVDADEANELAAMWEAKGDIISHGTSTFSRLAVGTNDYVLQADSTAASGLAWGQVDTGSIANDAVTNAKIAAGAVDTAELAADAVNGTKIADDSIDSEHYVDGSIDRVHLAADIVNGTKIADDSIDSEHYVDGSIDEVHIANNAVTADKIAAGAVGSSEIAAGAVGASELASTGVAANTYGDANSVGTFTVDADGRLTSASNTDIAIAQSQVTNLVSDLAGKLGTSAKAADSDKLDNLDSTQFLRSDADDTGSGRVTLTKTGFGNDWSTAQLILDPGSDAGIAIRTSNNDNFTVQLRAGGTTASGPPRLFVTGDVGGGGSVVWSDIECRTVQENSARRFKDNIVSAYADTDNDAIEKVKQIPLSSFNYLDNPSETVVGVVAEDLIDVLPEAVVYRDDEVSSVVTQRITYTALGALKQAINKIEALEARIAELESN